jgi:ATP-dependent helicase/nuclease subunit A
MTIHAAKGLEFPITIVTGLTTVPPGKSSDAVVWHRDTWTIASKEGDELYDEFQPIDEQMSDAERRRLLYVACTRAVDHLVVSLHRVPGKDGAPANRLPSGALLAEHGAADPESGAEPFVANAGGWTAVRPAPDELAWADPDAWAAERSRALRTAARRLTVSATRLADDLATELPAWADPGAADDEGLRKDPVDLELPPWQRGRYGTAVGRAVHGTLQFCDLVSGADIDSLAAAQCAAEGIIGLDDTVAALARSALAAPIVRTATTGEHHRELFVAATVGDRVLEGYVDLLVRTADGYVIVDYKTDAWRAGAHRAERIARYRHQLAAYGVTLERILGEPVVGGVLVHCRAGGPAEEIPLDGWPDALAELRAALAG